MGGRCRREGEIGLAGDHVGIIDVVAGDGPYPGRPDSGMSEGSGVFTLKRGFAAG